MCLCELTHAHATKGQPKYVNKHMVAWLKTHAQRHTQGSANLQLCCGPRLMWARNQACARCAKHACRDSCACHPCPRIDTHTHRKTQISLKQRRTGCGLRAFPGLRACSGHCGHFEGVVRAIEFSRAISGRICPRASSG